MSAISGRGVLALWNGVDPAALPVYDVWHTREHVPERISVAGMIGARRYARADGPMPQFLTIYDLEDLSVLTSAPYLRLLSEPTPWSRDMRPAFRGFMRVCCRREYTAGGGTGGAAAAVMLRDGAVNQLGRLRQHVAEMIMIPQITAAHLLIRDESVPDVPFSIGGDAPDFPRSGALLIEGYDTEALSHIRSAVADGLGTASEAVATDTFTIYRLAYGLDRSEIDRLPEPASFRKPQDSN